jgi:hypothetical protein
MILKGYKPAQGRGWRRGSESGVNLNVNAERERYTITWGDGTVVATLEGPASALPRTIEHDPEELAQVDEERRRQGDTETVSVPTSILRASSSSTAPVRASAAASRNWSARMILRSEPSSQGGRLARESTPPLNARLDANQVVGEDRGYDT